ncbi:phage baseplate protein, partial [Leptospira sp. SA-E8]|uniref:phage baseplate protein n=1 Tax=Leptospira sp. SA-E8 TaxID=3422259 RepID=UPI003EBA9EF3
MANHTPFDIEENEIALLARMGERMTDQARMFDPGLTDPENLPEGALRLNLSARKFEKLGPGGIWSDALDYLAMKVNELQSAAVVQVLQAAYPVGSVYINASVDTNPNALLGFGTWTEIGAGRVLVGQDTSNALFDALAETGGSADTTVVAHSHSFSTSSTPITGSFSVIYGDGIPPPVSGVFSSVWRESGSVSGGGGR